MVFGIRVQLFLLTRIKPLIWFLRPLPEVRWKLERS